MKIIVNGTEREIPHSYLHYSELLALARMSGTPSATYHWSRPGSDLSRSGIIAPNKGVDIADGMVFNIVHTGNA